MNEKIAVEIEYMLRLNKMITDRSDNIEDIAITLSCVRQVYLRRGRIELPETAVLTDCSGDRKEDENSLASNRLNKFY